MILFCKPGYLVTSIDYKVVCKSYEFNAAWSIRKISKVPLKAEAAVVRMLGTSQHASCRDILSAGIQSSINLSVIYFRIRMRNTWIPNRRIGECAYFQFSIQNRVTVYNSWTQYLTISSLYTSFSSLV